MYNFSCSNYIPYNQLESCQNKKVIYDSIIDKCVDIKTNSKLFNLCISLALANITMKFYDVKPQEYGSVACVYLETVGEIKKGSVVIYGSKLKEKIIKIKNILIFYEQNYFPSIYRKIKNRLEYASEVYKNLKNMRSKPIWEQCVQKEMCKKLIGSGNYGNVYSCMVDIQLVAVKVSKLKPEALNDIPYSTNLACWHEINLLKNVIKNIIKNKKCPNLPYIIDSFVCKKCTLNIDNKKIVCPCATTIIELADGNLKDWLSVKRNEDEIKSALFQIMAGLHAIQKYGQIMNFDVKKENILYYKIEPGGYWKYIIHGKKYKVPNLGYLFILTDFGLARPMSPEYPLFKKPTDETYRLGHRLGIIINKKIEPFMSKSDDLTIFWEDKKTSKGGQSYMKRDGSIETNIILTDEIKKFLITNKISNNPKKKKFYSYSEIIPPFEFYNDTQDGVRMFIGGKRTTQQGNHKKYSHLSKEMYNKLLLYKGKGLNMEDKIFSYNPSQILAGYFIGEFFIDWLYNDKTIPIETYKLST